MGKFLDKMRKDIVRELKGLRDRELEIMQKRYPDSREVRNEINRRKGITK